MKTDSKGIERVAAAWMARREAGLSSDDEQAFAHWLKVDARHARSYRQLDRSWSRLGQLRGSAVAARLEAELDELDSPTESPVEFPARHSRRRLAPDWLSGALAASLVWGLVYLAWWRPQRANRPHAETVATAVGAVRTMELPDGSVVRLNTDSAIEVLFTPGERRVRLGRGEVFLAVAKNPARPFIVSAAGVDVRAVGTEFNVRLHHDALEVVVSEGKVRVDDAVNGASLLAPASESATTPAILSAGHRVTIPVVPAARPTAVAAMPIPVAALEIERSLAWRERKLVFESAPLAVIVAEFNRYNPRPLVVGDPELAPRLFGGTFDANDTATFLELLRTTDEVVSEERDGEIVLGRR